MKKATFRLGLISMACVLALTACNKEDGAKPQPKIVQFVYTSDTHFGITRNEFRGASNVGSKTVNEALVAQINSLNGLTLPNDGGIRAGQPVDGIDFVINTGDMANRAEAGCLPALESWNQYTEVFGGLDVKRTDKTKAPLLISPGNHDLSNAIGHPKIPADNVDASVMANIYNYVFKPSAPKTKENYNFYTDKINYSVSYKGLHFVFVNIWPDAATRNWIAQDIENVKAPVLLFTHDQPDIEAKHLLDWRSDATTNNYVFTSKFENLVTDATPENATTDISTEEYQKGLTSFLAANKKIKAYFHGNSNFTQFYTYTGVPAGSISLPVFRADSPMKGEYSADDETKLAFELVTINTETMHMTVRECLWNTTKSAADKIVWGQSKTVSIR